MELSLANCGPTNQQLFEHNVFDIQEMTMNPVYPKDRVIFGNVASICGERYVIIVE